MSTAKTTKMGTVEKVIKSVDRDPEKAQINISGAEPLHQEIRIENTFTDENGTKVKLKEGAKVEVHVEATKSDTISKKTLNQSIPQIRALIQTLQTTIRTCALLIGGGWGGFSAKSRRTSQRR
jgi:predicted DNA-binding antitoxin AbrB/MazE fold protein